MIQENTIKEKPINYSSKKSVSVDNYTDRMASYAAIIGRAIACGVDPTQSLTRVGDWMDGWFVSLNISSKMRTSDLFIFMQGTEYHMKQQSGNSQDTCGDAINTFNSIRWP